MGKQKGIPHGDAFKSMEHTRHSFPNMGGIAVSRNTLGPCGHRLRAMPRGLGKSRFGISTTFSVMRDDSHSTLAYPNMEKPSNCGQVDTSIG